MGEGRNWPRDKSKDGSTDGRLIAEFVLFIGLSLGIFCVVMAFTDSLTVFFGMLAMYSIALIWWMGTWGAWS